MPALTANANTIQFISEDATHVTVLLLLHQAPAGNQNSSLVINATALQYATEVLTINPGTARFVPGDFIHDISGNSNASGYVCYNITANTILVTKITGNTAFTDMDVIMGNREDDGTANVTAVQIGPYQLNIENISWSVTDLDVTEAKVGLEFANSSVYQTAYFLSDSGNYGRNQFDSPIPPNVVAGNGNLYVSTYDMPAGGGYAINIRLRKYLGYASVPIY